jgi:hypothetical protein
VRNREAAIQMGSLRHMRDILQGNERKRTYLMGRSERYPKREIPWTEHDIESCHPKRWLWKLLVDGDDELDSQWVGKTGKSDQIQHFREVNKETRRASTYWYRHSLTYAPP